MFYFKGEFFVYSSFMGDALDYKEIRSLSLSIFNDLTFFLTSSSSDKGGIIFFDFSYLILSNFGSYYRTF